MPGFQKSRLACTAGKLIPSDRVATEDAIDLADFLVRDLAKLSSQLERIEYLVAVLPLRHIFPSSQWRVLQLTKVISRTDGVHLEELGVVADAGTPRA